MPGNVDERIVEMRIDNKQFESGAKTTISTLEKLERALNIKSGSKALDDMANTVSKFDASPMTSAIEKVGESFNVLEIAGRRVIENLTDGIYNFASRTVKQLVIEQPKEGWNKYETKAEAVQSIMAATRDMVTGISEVDDNGIAISFADQEEQMAKVNELLEQMNWFTDETSYNFNDMAANVGKFLAAGTGLEDTFTAIMGIASWGGSAGAKPQEVSRAMYNISQAMSSGSMKAIDWKSIENAGMATLEFKQNAIDAAVAMGKLNKWTDTETESLIKYYEAGEDASMLELDSDKLFDAKSFREGLASGWFDSEVMMEVFKRYGEFSDKLYAATESTGLEATEVLQLVDKLRDNNADINWEKYAHDASMAVDEFKAAIESVSDVNWEFSENGFRMGQEAKTWTDMIEATKDAVSSEWMKTFQYIFGDYLEAKEFWTEMTSEFWEIFAAGGALRNEILDSWYSSGGRTALFGLDEDNLGAFWNILNAIKTFVNPIQEALSEIFGTDTEDGIRSIGERLAETTKNFQELTKNMGLSEDAQAGLKNIFTTIFSGAKIVLKAFGGVIAIIGKFAWAIGEVLDAVLSLASGEITFETVQERVISSFGFVSNIVDRVKNVFKSFSDSIKAVISYFNELKDNGPSIYLNKLFETMTPFEQLLIRIGKRFPIIVNAFSFLNNVAQIAIGIVATLLSYLPSFDTIVSIIKDIPQSLDKIKNYFNIFKHMKNGTVLDILYKSMNPFEQMIVRIGRRFPILITGFDAVRSAIQKVISIGQNLFSNGFHFDTVLSSMVTWFTKLKNAVKGINVDFSGSGSIFEFVKNALKNVKIDPSKIKNVASGVKTIVETLITSLFGDMTVFKEKIKNLIATIFSGVSEAIHNIKVSDILKAIRLGLIAGFLGGFLKFIRSFDIVMGEVQTIRESISGMFDSVTDTFKAMQTNIKVSSLIKIAVAAGILAAALVALAKIPADDFTRVALGVGLLFAVLSKFGKNINIFSGSNNTGDTITKGLKANIKLMPDLAATLLALAFAFGVVSKSIIQFKKYGIGKGKGGWADLVMPIGTFIITLGTIFGFLYLLKKYNFKDIGKSFGLLITVFAIIGRLTHLIKATKNVKWQNILATMAGMTAVILAMAVLLRFASGFKKFKDNSILHVGALFLSVGFAIRQIAAAMIPLAVMPWKAMIKALIGVGALLLMLGGMIGWMSRIDGGNTGGLLKIAGSMALMAVSIKLLIGPLLAIAAIPWGGLLKGIAIIGILMLMLGGLTAWMSRLNSTKAGGLLMIVGAVTLLSLALGMLLPSVIAFTGFMVMLAAVLNGKMILKLGLLAVIMGVLGAGMLIAGAGVALFGAGLLGVSISAFLFSLAILAIVSALNKLGEAMPNFIEGLIHTGELMTGENLKNIAFGAVAFIALAAGIFLVAKAFGALFGKTDVIGQLGAFGGKLVSGLGTLFHNIGTKITENLPGLLKILSSIAVIVGLYLIGLIPSFVNTIVQAIATLLESVHQSVRANKGALEHSIFGTVEVLLEILLDSGTWVVTVIRSLIDEFVRNILEGVASIAEKIPGVGKKWANKIRGAADELPGPEELMSQWRSQKATNEEWLQTFVPPAEPLKDAAEEVPKSIGTGILNGKGSVDEAINDLKTTIADTVNGFKETATGDGETATNNFAAGLLSGKESVDTNTTSIADSVMGIFGGMESDSTTAGWNVLAGLDSGITNYWNEGSIQSNLDTITNSINNRLRLGFDENSPSKISEKAGEFYIIGLANGIANNAKTAISSVDDVTNPMVDALRNAVMNIAAVSDDEMTISPTITPVVDLSNVKSAAGSIGTVLGGSYSSYTGTMAAKAASISRTMATGNALNISSKNQDVVSELKTLHDQIGALGNAITNMQIVLDSGVMVGAMTPQLDMQLGKMAVRKGRGN